MAITDYQGNEITDYSTTTGSTSDYSGGVGTDYPSTMSVGQLFMKIIRRLPDFTQEMDFLSAVQLAIDTCTRVLREAKSDLLKADIAQVVAAALPYDPTATYAAGDRALYTDPTGTIPLVEWVCSTAIESPEAWTGGHWSYPSYANFTLDSRFRGFVDFLWITMPMQRPIYPIPDIKLKAYYKIPSTPDYYELRYLTVTLYPTPSMDLIINGEIYVNPTPIESMDSYLPFGGLLDQAITEAVMMIGKNGLSITVDPKFREFMRDQIALVHHLRPAKMIEWTPPPTGRCRQWLV